MKFGLFYEMQLPKPWDDDSEYRIYKESIEQVKLADSLGYDYIWEVEHHFLEEYSHSSAPELFLAAASQVTKNVRLGHGIVLTPPPYNHPVRIAERISVLDLLSDGRVDFGSGESTSDMELGAFHVSRDEKFDMWLEGLRAALTFMRPGPQEFHGKYVDVPLRNVIPKPRQKPHPPLWTASGRAASIDRAAHYGLGALGFDPVEPDEVATRVNSYLRVIREDCDPVGEFINAKVAMVSPFMCCKTDEEALAKGLHGSQFFIHALAHFYYGPDPSAPGQPGHIPGQGNVTEDYWKRPSDAVKTWPRGCIGSPEYIQRRLQSFEDAGLDLIIFIAQAGFNKHDDIMESIDMFGRTVMKPFQERDEALRKKKVEGLRDDRILV